MSDIPSLYVLAKQCLDCCDPVKKVELTHFYARQWNDGLITLQKEAEPQKIEDPGRPQKPELVHPSKVTKRKINTEQGRQALIHAICHIEFNAINLAWDAVYRFRDMPEQFYSDWIKVADEEAYHFSLLLQRLQELGSNYGEFSAHNGLWEMACKTDYDVMVRMALVPRVLEARGLDVTPGMMQRLSSAGDKRSLKLLEIILRDEVGHVAIGSHWFKYLCEQRGLDAEQTFIDLLDKYMKGYVKGPFYEQARLDAGFSENELLMLKQQAGQYEK